MKRKVGFFVMLILLVAASAWAMKAIKTQLSTDANFELSVIRAKVKGEVLTFQVVFKNTSSKKRQYAFYFKDVYYTDAKSKKKYYALRDTRGLYIAGPAYDHNGGGSFNVWIEPQAKAIFWIKFPVPGKDTKSIDLYIPWALPIEDVKLER